jgi:hypothetical protein
LPSATIAPDAGPNAGSRPPSSPREKSLRAFDFDANPNIDPAVIHTLAKCEWVQKGQPLCLIGDSGTGKSHLLIALGTEAAMAGYRVKFTLATQLANELVEAPMGCGFALTNTWRIQHPPLTISWRSTQRAAEPGGPRRALCPRWPRRRCCWLANRGQACGRGQTRWPWPGFGSRIATSASRGVLTPVPGGAGSLATWLVHPASTR